MNRREFIKLSGIGLLTMIIGDYKTLEAATKKVDFHSHAILSSYVNGLKKLNIDAVAEEGFPLPKWSAKNHLKFMSDAEIDFSVLSMPTPHIFNGDENLSCEVARAINEEFAVLCKEYPDKFGFVATLPLPSVEGSITEIKYVNKNMKALGFKVASNSYGVYLGDKILDPIFEELNRQKALVIMHPSPARQLPHENVVTGRVMALYEYPADTTRAVLNMLANGTLEKYPDIKFVVPHCGSFLPYMKQRAGAMFQMLSSMKMMESVNIEDSIKRLYFDLAGDPMPDSLDMLLKITDIDHIVYGSDYPYVPAPILLKKKKILDEHLKLQKWTDKIYSNNAKVLLI